jgi:hypothetical protein
MYDIYSKLWDGENINIEYYRELINKDPDEVSVAEYEALMMMFDKVAEDMASEDTDIREQAIEQMEDLLNSSYIDGHAVGTLGPGPVSYSVTEWALSPVIPELSRRHDITTYPELSELEANEIGDNIYYQGKIFITNILNTLPQKCYGYPQTDITISPLMNKDGKPMFPSSSSYNTSHAFEVIVDYGISNKSEYANKFITVPLYRNTAGYNVQIDDLKERVTGDESTPLSLAVGAGMSIANATVGMPAVASIGVEIAGIYDKATETKEKKKYVENLDNAESLQELYTTISANVSFTLNSEGQIQFTNVKYDEEEVISYVGKYKSLLDEPRNIPEGKKKEDLEVTYEEIESILNGSFDKSLWEKYAGGDEKRLLEFVDYVNGEKASKNGGK